MSEVVTERSGSAEATGSNAGEARHTAGPWQAVNEGDFSAQVQAHEGWTVVVRLDRKHDGSPRYREATHADAMLIAAAPAMLKALRAIVSADATGVVDIMPEEVYANAIRAIRAATEGT